MSKRKSFWICLAAFLALLIGAGSVVGVAFASQLQKPAFDADRVSSGGVNKTLDTATPTPTCPVIQDYVVTQTTGASLIPGVTDIGNHCDECTTTVTLPFPVSFYGTSFSTALVGSNGTIGFTANANSYNNNCLPYAGAADFIAPYWDDQLTRDAGDGIFSTTVGNAPNRVFALEWRSCLYNAGSCGAPLDYEVLLHEDSSNIEIVYATVGPATSMAYTVGIQKGTGTKVTQYTCPPTANLSAGLQLSFAQLPCGAPTFTPSPTNTRTGTPTRTFTRTPTNTRVPSVTPGGPTLTPTITNTPTVTHSPTSTPTPTVTPMPIATCGPGSDYVIEPSTGATIAAGATDMGNHCDDCVTTITLPFTYNLYAQPFSTVGVSSNGNLQFGGTLTSFTNLCLPDTAFGYSIFPYWDDLDTTAGLAGCSALANGCGVYTSVSGNAPDRIFDIEWHAVYFSDHTQAADFEVRLYEGQDAFDIIYGRVDQGGVSATIGVQRAIGATASQFDCNQGVISPGLRLHFRPMGCGEATQTPTSTSTATDTATPTITPGGPTSTPTDTYTPVNTPTPTFTVTATSTPPACGPGSNYVVATVTGTLIPGTTLLPGSQADDAVVNVPLPFTYYLYGVPFTGVNAGVNGNLQFGSSVTEYVNNCLPAAAMSYLVAPLWDDLMTNQNGGADGIYVSVNGSAPNRIFAIEWRACIYNAGNCGGAVNFEALLYEGQDRLDFVYGVVTDNGGPHITGDAGATIGVQHGMGPQDTLYSCNTASLSTGLQLVFTEPPCIPPTATGTPTPACTPYAVGHLGWQTVPQPNSRNAQPLTVTIKSGVTEVNFATTADASGFFTVPLGSGFPTAIPASWRVKGPRHLASCGLLTIAPDGCVQNSFEAGTQRGGDCNPTTGGNNVSNAQDFNTLKNQFGQSGPLLSSDFDYTRTVNVSDFNILKSNFGQSGCGPAIEVGDQGSGIRDQGSEVR